MSFRALFLRLLLALAALFPLAGHRVSAQTLLADATSAPYHTVVHFGISGVSGRVQFADNGTPLTTIPASPQGVAVLAVATLAPGVHVITASSSAGLSNAVALTVTPLPAPFQLAADAATYIFAGNELNFLVTGLPPRATGQLTYAQDGVPFDTPNLQRDDPRPTYIAFGDSITAQNNAGDTTIHYPGLFATTNGFTHFLDFGNSGDMACDTLARAILPYPYAPTQDFSPLYTLMIGTNDADRQGVPLGESNFTTCHRAALAWLGIPREFKILPGDPGLVFTGDWALPPQQFDSTYTTLYNTSGAGSATFTVISQGGPLYLWYLMGDHLTGAFKLAVDGTPTGLTYTTNPATPIGSHNNPDSTGIALLRFPVAPGVHSLRVDILSGTVGLLAAATPPSPDSTSVHPLVLAADVPFQSTSNPLVTPDVIQQYSADAADDIALLAADGLNLRSFSTHPFLTGDPADYNDSIHPGNSGHLRLLAAFQAAFNNEPLSQFLTCSSTVPRNGLLTQDLGLHTYSVAYSGDPYYAPATSSVTATVIPDSLSVTTLATAATRYYAAEPLAFTAGIYPPNPGATIALLEGKQTLATAVIPYKNAAFTLPSLPPGLHTLYAAYGGDRDNAASFSPPIAIQVLQNPTTLLLAAPAHADYADALTLAATLAPLAATGTVLFSDSYTPPGQVTAQSVQPVGQATLANGAATLALSALLPGTHTVTASYSGDANDEPGSSAAAAIVIGPIPTVTTLAGTGAAFGQTSTFSATVSPAAGTTAVAGTVTFTDTASAATVQAILTDGTATWSTGSLPPGSHTITAIYAGDNTHSGSASTGFPAAVARAASTTALTASAASIFSGAPVTLTVAVNPAFASGSVLFSDPAAGILGQATLTNGTATLTLPALPVGAYTLTAAYPGDTNTLASASTPVLIKVLSKATTTTLTAPATAHYGAPLTLVVAVTNAPAGALLRFAEGTTPLGTTALDAHGNATFSAPTLAPGSHTLTATYAGDPTHDPSTDTATTTISAATSTTTLSITLTTLLAGSPAVVTVAVATPAGTPTGTIRLLSGTTLAASGSLANGANGTAYTTFSLPTPTTGTFPLTAVYSGDPNTEPSDTSASPAAYTVAPRIATGALTLSAAQVPPQTPVTLTASFSSPGTTGPALVPTGTVAFLNGTAVLATVALDSSGQATATLPPAALGTYTLTAVYLPTGVFTASAVPARTLTVTPPLAVAFADSSLTLEAASSATAVSMAHITPLSGYAGTLATECTTPALYLTCTVDAPATLAGPATAQVHLALAQHRAALTHPGHLLAEAATLACLLPLVFTGRRRRLPTLLFLALFALTLTAVTGCGEGGTFGQVPAGLYHVQLTVTAADTPSTATLDVTIH